VAPFVAGFPSYLEPLAWHLLRSKLRHWDKSLRELAAQALAGALGGGGARHQPVYSQRRQRALPPSHAHH
jgi:hypothetical protein